MAARTTEAVGTVKSAPFIAVYDACVLYPAPLRDLLMHLALTGLFQARWTEKIHEEWMRNLRRDRPELSAEKLERVRRLMDAHAEDCLVTGYEGLIGSLALPDPNDRHVLAAAIQAKARTVVTYNLSDFPAASLAQHGTKAQHPDAFILGLLEMDREKVLQAVRDQRASLRNPPVTAEELLATLEKQRLVHTIASLRETAGLL